MPDRGSPSEIGERIERLLKEVRAMASPPAWQRIDELIRTILEIYGSALANVVQITSAAGPSGEALLKRFTDDSRIASLLILHGLHPEDFAARVRKALIQVRPYLGSHGGDVELLEADATTGVVRLRMAGSCESCPSSTVTVKLAVEGAISEVAPELTSIEVEGLEPTDQGARNGFGDHAPKWTMLGDPPQVAPGTMVVAQIGGARILLCRVGPALYAYRDTCPKCAGAIHAGTLADAVLTCPSCGQRFDVRLAGRCVDDREVHLDPVPLLENDAGVKVALAQASA